MHYKILSAICFHLNQSKILSSGNGLKDKCFFFILIENVEHLLSAANYIQILPVVEACVDYLKSHLVMTNCVDMITISELFSLKNLRSHVYKYISSHFASLAISTEFLRLSLTQLENLLNFSYPVDCAEVDVFSAVIGWIVHHHGNSAKHALKFLPKIDITSLLPEELKGMHNFLDFEKMLFDSESGMELQSYVKSQIGTNIIQVEGLLNVRGYEKSLVVCGGFLPGSGMTNDVQYYNTVTGSLHLLTTVPHVEQCHFGMTSLQNRLYVIGGCYNDDRMEEITHGYGFCYSPQTQQWTSIPPMMNERCRFFLGAVRNKLYAIGGDPSASQEPLEHAKCECFDPQTNRWSSIAMLPGNRTEHAGTVLGDRLYISGGLQDPDDRTTFDTFYEYNPDSNTWSQLPSMLVPRADHTMFAHDGKIYVIGGYYHDSVTNQRVMASTIDCFDFDKGCWEEISQTPTPRLFASYSVLNDRVIVIGGWFNGDYQHKCKSLQTFDLIGRKWCDEINTTTEIWEHASCSIYLPFCKD